MKFFTKNNNKLALTNKKNLIFYICMMAFPVLQFCIFWLGVNGNSILLAFKSYNTVDNSYVWNGLNSFTRILSEVKTSSLIHNAIKNSFISYFVLTGVTTPLSLLFSFFIYKKMRFGKVFQVILFLPAIISSIAMVIIFTYFVERALPQIMEKVIGKSFYLLENPETQFGTILFYNIWTGFGVSLLMYSGAMSSVSEEVSEAATIDGATAMREFFSIVLPKIFPTITTFLVTGVAGIFVSQINLFSFFGSTIKENVVTFGYFLFAKTQGAVPAEYPYLATYGILLTAIAVPMTLLVKIVLEKIGPSEE